MASHLWRQPGSGAACSRSSKSEDCATVSSLKPEYRSMGGGYSKQPSVLKHQFVTAYVCALKKTKKLTSPSYHQH